MMATDKSPSGTTDEKDNTTLIKKPKRGKPTPLIENTKDVIENGNDSLSETISARLSKSSDTKKANESALLTSTSSIPKDDNTGRNSYRAASTNSIPIDVNTGRNSYRATSTDSLPKDDIAGRNSYQATSTNSIPKDDNAGKNNYRATLTNSISIDDTPARNSNRSNKQLTPLQSTYSGSQTYQHVELTAVTDDDDDEDPKRDLRREIKPTNHITTDPETMLSSYTTGGENDTIEIHEFSLADIDAYLDIYFETLNNRLGHLIGSREQLQEFRLALKTRISSDTNSNEYQNVLLGKMNGDVVAAVKLSFPGEPGTIANTNILPQSSSCFTSMRRWMIRNANYTPTNIEECYIEMIGVKTAFRNNGIGGAMMECVEHFARQAGARLLTIHVHDDQLRQYFGRSGFSLDHTDNSAIWKWLVERQNVLKMSKTLSSEDDPSMDNVGGHNNESMAGSEGE
ncbi:unnamed protein product [Adineta steineri]|uniref:N-acetyltransferase domain-containing protein n=1 Tax=Adineta steineri TaxID=433720 RepID=A0A813ZCK1_9BILA|nr:unnamed protein product [Adineta steineri]